MSTITKKDLSIFRGTYLECKAQPTEDMKIYLAWDTHEIYVGNAYGEKTLYGVSKSLFERINLKFVELESFMDSKVSNYVDEKFDELLDLKLADLKKDLELVISEKVKFHVDLKSMALQGEINNNKLSITELKNSVNKYKQDFELNKESVKNEVNLLKQSIESNKSSITGLRNTTNIINNNLNKSLTKLQNDFNTAYRSLETSFTEAIKLEIGILTGTNLDNFTTVSEIINDLKQDVFVDTQRLEGLINKRVLETDFKNFKEANETNFNTISNRINKLDDKINTESTNRINAVTTLNSKIDSTKDDLTKVIVDTKNDIFSKMDALIGTEVNGEGLFSKINSIETKHDSEVLNLQNQINLRAKSEDLIAESARIDTLGDNLSEAQATVTVLNTQVSTIESNLKSLATKLEVQNLSSNVDKLAENLGVTNQNIDKNADNILNLDERITSIENYGIDASITDRISALENVDKDINSSILDINNKVGVLPEGEDDLVSFIQSKNELIETDITAINNRLDNIESTISIKSEVVYLTATQMNTEDLDDYTLDNGFILIFCTADLPKPLDYTPPKRYKAGRLYYYSGNSITEISGGGSGTIEKDVVTASVSALNITNWPIDQEISNTTFTFSSSSITSTITGDLRAVNTVSLKYNNGENIALNSSGNISATKDISFSAATAGTHTVTLTVTSKTDEEYIDYVVNNGTRSKTVTFYKPTLFGIDGNLKHYADITGKFTFGLETDEIIPKDATIFYYTPSDKPIEIKTEDGFGGGFVKTNGTVKLTVNGVTDVEYYEYKLEGVNDTSVVFIIKEVNNG